MRASLLLALLAGLGLTTLSSLPAPAADPRPSAAKLRQLIDQLGSASFTEREEATAALDAAGEPALPGLRKAVESDDAEVRRRAGDLLKKIEQRVDAEHLLAPAKVKLWFKDTPLSEAVAELSKKTGCHVTLQDPTGRLRDRKVTLEAGEITFWEALDRLCAGAGLVDEDPPFANISGESVMIIRGPALPGALPPPPVASRRRLMPGGPMTVLPQLTLAESRSPAPPSTRVGAVRVRAVRTPGSADDNSHISLNLTVTAEPNVHCYELFTVRVGKVVDDQGQELHPADDTVPGMAGFARRNPLVFSGGYLVQQLPARLTAGEKPSKSLREFHGTLSARLMTEPRPVLAADNLLNSAGKTFRGKEGGEIKVLEATREDSGEVTIRCEVDFPPEISPASIPVNAAVGRGRAGARGFADPLLVVGPGTLPRRTPGLSIVDDKGDPIEQTVVRSSFRRDVRGITREFTLVAQPAAGREAAKLVFAGSKVVNVEIPFTIKDIPLP
jgi:hypothetical protein